MGTAVIAIIAFAMVLGVAFTALGDLLGLSVTSADSLRSSWREAERRANSSLSPVLARVSDDDLEVLIDNSGRLKYAPPEFENWEVVVRYEDGLGASHLEFVEYSPIPAEGKWTVLQIYLDPAPTAVEVYEPGIFNPGEQMLIEVQLDEEPGASTHNQVTISPPEGGVGVVYFSG